MYIVVSIIYTKITKVLRLFSDKNPESVTPPKNVADGKLPTTF